jgi:hypothetical protein
MINFKDKLLGSYYFSWLQIFTNWLMQGILHADKSERNYKIFFTIFFSFLIISVVYFTIGQVHIVYFLYSLLISHSVNFFLNCNLSVLFIHRIRWFKTNKKNLFKHLLSIQSRLDNIQNKEWILFCVSHGGICNGTLNSHSDIDVSIVRKPGFINLIKAIIFYVKEKKIADLNMVPLDIFICDSAENTISRSNFQKNPIVLLDHNNIVDIFYKDKLKMSLDEAHVLNEI